MSSALILLEPATAPAIPDALPDAEPCADCGAVLYAGQCLEVGRCAGADVAATRGAARTSAKYRPAAWTFAGGVD